MYTLYYSPGACSLATQVVLRELNQDVEIINVADADDFKSINPVGSVPALIDRSNSQSNEQKTLTEGAAIILYLLNKHPNSLIPEDKDAYQTAVQQIMFANATVHPAYSKLFFIAESISDESAKFNAFNAAADKINQLWQVVENQLADRKFLGGEKPSAADIMLTVYSRWGQYFPVDIILGEQTKNMIAAVEALPSFIQSVEAEHYE